MNTETTALSNFNAPKKSLNALFAQEKITPQDIENMTEPERRQLAQAATKILGQLKGDERDSFLEKIEQIVPATTKSDVWEYNHQTISTAITAFMAQHGIMPTKNAIAEQTGLSRQTVAKHFKDYKTSPEFEAHMEQFKFMAPRILTNVFKFASNGDMRAAKLYFEMVGTLGKPQANTVVNGQTNYIQINNTILSQENLKQLSADQLNQIENIVTNKQYKMIS